MVTNTTAVSSDIAVHETAMQSFIFKTYNEEELTWQQHNDIHRVLNQAYAHRTKSFFKKTYADRQPIKRIICEMDNQIVGHTAIFEVTVMLDKEPIKIGGIGMTLSLKPFCDLGRQLRKSAIEVCRQLNYPLAIGRIKNSANMKRSLQPLVACFLDTSLVGASTASHVWEILAVYDTHTDMKALNRFCLYFNSQPSLIIDGEVF